MTNKPTPVSSYHMYDESLLFWEHDGKEYCLRVDQVGDDAALNPRGDMYHDSIMFCVHPRYKLGDDLSEKTPTEFWTHLIEENMSDADIAAKLRSNSIHPHNADSNWGQWDKLSDNELAAYFLEHIADYEDFQSAAQLLDDYVAILPLWLYDHSGITMSCGARCYPYNDQWDSSAVGWIAIGKKYALTLPETDKTNWKQKAEELLTKEVKEYDQYLTGDVYGYAVGVRTDHKILENETASDEFEWEEDDSSYGFYGSDILSNGICDSVERGLKEAILENRTTPGHIEKKTVTYLTYVKEEAHHG